MLISITLSSFARSRQALSSTQLALKREKGVSLQEPPQRSPGDEATSQQLVSRTDRVRWPGITN